jgi:F-type H+-transporting ATPase subunit alpha
MRKLAGILRLEYIQFKELEKLTRIKAGVSEAVEQRLRKGRVVAEILKQDKDAPVPMEEQIVLLFALANGFMDHLMPDQVNAYQGGLRQKILRDKPELLRELVEKKDLTDGIKGGLHEQLTAYGRGAV